MFVVLQSGRMPAVRALSSSCACSRAASGDCCQPTAAFAELRLASSPSRELDLSETSPDDVFGCALAASSAGDGLARGGSAGMAALEDSLLLAL